MNASGEWKLAAAYDLTFLNLSHGLHSTMSAGESRSPGEQQLFELANTIAVKDPKTIIDQAKSVLADWNSYAKDSGVGDDSKK